MSDAAVLLCDLETDPAPLLPSWLDSWQPVNIASVTRNGGVSAQVTLKDFSCTLGDCNPITPGLQSKFAGVNLKSELDRPGVSGSLLP